MLSDPGRAMLAEKRLGQLQGCGVGEHFAPQLTTFWEVEHPHVRRVWIQDWLECLLATGLGLFFGLP